LSHPVKTGELRKVDSLLPGKPDQSTEDRAEEIEEVLNWLRNEGVTLADDEAPPSFNKVGIRPVTRRSPEERANDLDNGLAWVRNNHNCTDDPTGILKKIDSMLPT
jgi:hypothetical protein